MKNTRFLYGKKINFESFLKTGSLLWFRYLYSLGKLENQLISDDESKKNHIVNSDQLQKVNINGRDFMLGENSTFKMELPTRRCHVLCLSNSGNNEVLFKRFDANVCIELNTDKIIEMVREGNRNKNLEIVGRDVEYYKKGPLPSNQDPFELVFRKEYEKYHIEDEYRISIFWTKDEGSTILTTDNNWVSVFGQHATSDDHIKIGFDPSVIVSVFEFKDTMVKRLR